MFNCLSHNLASDIFFLSDQSVFLSYLKAPIVVEKRGFIWIENNCHNLLSKYNGLCTFNDAQRCHPH